MEYALQHNYCKGSIVGHIGWVIRYKQQFNDIVRHEDVVQFYTARLRLDLRRNYHNFIYFGVTRFFLDA